MTALLAVVAAFLVGFAMKYGGLCTYAAALQIVREQRFERLMAFLAAAAWTALLVVPLAWLHSDELQLSGTHYHWGMALMGGALLGLGAWLNRGCVFGTFVQLTGGNLTYVATLMGMVVGAVGAKYALSGIAPIRTEASLLATPDVWAVVWLLLAAVIALMHVTDFSFRTGEGRRGLQPVSAILVATTLGAGGGWLFAAVNGWDFATVLMRTAWHLLELAPAGPALLAISCTLSMVGGGVAAAIRQQRFTWQTPALGQSLGCFLGGALMGLAAVVLPGGNDGLLLSGIPALAPHALTGFAMMLVSMLLLLVLLPNDKGFSIPGKRL